MSGTLWAAALAERDRHNDWQAAEFARAGVTTWEKPESAVEAAGRVSVTPFLTRVICVSGVDPDDGYVRDVIDDAKYVADMMRGYQRSPGTVREYLLTEIDGLCQQIESWRRMSER